MPKQLALKFFLIVFVFSLAFAFVAPLVMKTTQAQSSKTDSLEIVPNAPFSSGNLVIYRVGNGQVALTNTGSPVFLDEFRPDGTFVQTIPMPTTAAVGSTSRQLVASGTDVSEGFITRSTDFRYLVLTGYARDVPAPGPTPFPLPGTTSAAVPRVIGRVDGLGNVNTTTALTDAASGSNPRSAVSTDGSEFWFAGGSSGIRYAKFGDSASIQLTELPDFRQINIFNNNNLSSQLYVSAGGNMPIRVGSVGMGTPRTPIQTVTNLPGIPISGSPYAFFFADLNPDIPGPDVLYVADDNGTELGGIRKYSLVNGTWSLNGSSGVASDAYRGLTGVVNRSVSPPVVTLYATRNSVTGPAPISQFVTFVDGRGYNGAFVGVTPILRATALQGTAFRGIALAPLSPTAASLSISGRVVTNTGRGLMNARVTLTDTFNTTTRTLLTNSFGYFNFYDLSVGSIVIISIEHNRYTFAQGSTTIQLADNISDLSFTGSPTVR